MLPFCISVGFIVLGISVFYWGKQIDDSSDPWGSEIPLFFGVIFFVLGVLVGVIALLPLVPLV